MSTSILRDDIEYVIHCDQDGTIIGPLSKVHAHLPGPRQALTHHATWSMVYHLPSGRYGIQLKNTKKHDEFGAGRWDMSAAGHNCYIREKGSWKPMSFTKTLRKEVQEEIGLKVDILNSIPEFVQRAQKPLRKPIAVFIEQFHYHTPRNNEFVGLAFILTPTTKVEFQDQEVVDFKWLSPQELAQYLHREKNYCDPLPLVLEKVERFRKKYFGRT